MEFIKVESKQNQLAEFEPAIQWQPFPIDRLPPTMRDIAIGVQKTVGLKDSSTPAIATLATVSGLIGASCKIRIKPGYLQPAHLFTAIVQKSGQSKSGTKEHLIDPLQDIQGEWHADWERKKEDHERDMREWKSAKKGERPEYPIEPDPPKRIIVSDITIEAVGQRLKENPLGLLLYNDELDSYFGSMGRYNKGNDLPHWLSIHNGKPLTIDRKVGDYIRIANPSVAIIGGVQPYILKERLRENPDYFHSGFIARFLLAMPPVVPILLNDNVIPQAVTSGWEWFLERVLQQRESAMSEDGKQTPHVFDREPAAWNILTEYQHRHARAATFANEGESALEGKFLTNTARIALILHIVNLIESGGHLSDRMPIPGETMESACMIAEWFIDESKRIYAELAEGSGEDNLTPEQREVMRVLTRVGMAMTKDEMKHRSRPLQRIDKEGRLDSALSELVKEKRIQDNFRTGNGIKEGTIEYEIFTVTERIVTEPPKNTGIYGGLRYDTPVTSEKNEKSTLSEFDSFSDEQ